MFEADIHQGQVTTHILHSVVEKADPDQLLRYLPAVDQMDYKSHTQPTGWGRQHQPKFYWIFKNIDFKQWYYTNDPMALWVSGPAECHISDASSCIVDLVKGKGSQTQHLVLYFFCSPAKAPISITFVSAIIHQLLCHLPELKGKVTTVFLRTLLGTILGGEPLSDPERSRFETNDSADAIVEKILKPSTSGYWGALREAMDIEREKELSLIIDGLDKIEHQKSEFIQELCALIENLGKRPSPTRILLTSRPQPDIKEILGHLPSIEYDRERKGLVSLISCSQEGS